MNLEECKIYLKNFLNSKYYNKTLEEQLKNLKTYNFAQLGLKENIHEDSTKLAKAIYFIIWHTDDNEYSLPLLTSWQSMEENYGGETINTFNTLFQENLEGAKLYIPETDNEFYEKVKNFQNLYLTIGNFMLLPKKEANNSTLNIQKMAKYKDYSDLFFFNLFDTNNLDDLKEANKEYFENLSKEEFFKKNFLEDYYENNNPKIIFQHYNDGGKYYPYYWWQFRNTQAYSDEYKDFALQYMDKSTEIINYRADEMIGILKNQLEST